MIIVNASSFALYQSHPLSILLPMRIPSIKHKTNEVRPLLRRHKNTIRNNSSSIHNSNRCSNNPDHKRYTRYPMIGSRFIW